MKVALQELGFIVGNQRKAERLLPAYRDGNFDAIVNYCQSAQVFQDFPFSYPETYKHLDQAFPGSKFILTVRDSPEQWYNSVTKYHAKLFGKSGQIPTKDDLQNANYVWKGWMWECNRLMYATPGDEPYKKGWLIDTYNNYNQCVRDYFSGDNNTAALLVINLSESGSYRKLTDFLGVDSQWLKFPWENKTGAE